jgi:hypothetical protein
MRILLIIVALMLGAKSAEAHDIYSGLMDQLGGSCCDNTDCRPAHYRVTGRGVEMLLDDEWVRVPDAVIQHRTLHGDTGETDGGHWCGIIYPWGLEPAHPYYPALSPSRFYTRCVFLPPDLF